MKLHHLLIVLCLAAPATPALAQDEQDKSEKPKTENPAEPESHGSRLRWKDLPRNVLKDEKSIVTSPFHINRGNVAVWTLFGATTATLIATDRTVSRRMPDSSSAKSVGKWTSRLGANYSLYPMTAAFYIYGKADGNPRARDFSRLGIEALADSEILVNTLKAITQRPRPATRDASVAFFTGGDAFPSGHSIQAWSLARVFAREFPQRKIFPIIAYGLASTVSVSRIAARRHSPSDVFVGSAMGFFIGDYVYRHHHAPSPESIPVPPRK